MSGDPFEQRLFKDIEVPFSVCAGGGIFYFYKITGGQGR